MIRSRCWLVPIRSSWRSWIHLIGPRSLSERQATASSSGYTGSLTPNPPPESGEATRTCDGGMSRTSAMIARARYTSWKLHWIVSDSRPESYSATIPRVSSGVPVWRAAVKRRLTTPSARSKAPARSPHSNSSWK